MSLSIYAQEITPERVKEVNLEAIRLNREGKFKEAKKILDDLLIRLEEESSALKYKAVTWQTLAKVVMNQGDYEESFRLARKSLAYGISKADSLSMADNLNTIGINHYHLSDYDSTTYYYEKSLEIKRKVSNDLYSLAVSEYNLGIVYEDLGIPDRALQLYHAAEENLIRSGMEKNFLSDVYVGIAHIHFYAGDTDKGEIYAQKALQEGLRSYGEDNPNITFIYTSYANILEYQERHQESMDLLEKSLEIRRKSYGENHRWTCEAYYDLANAYRLDGQLERAEELFKKAIEIGRTNQSRQYLSYAETYLAGLYLDEEKNLEEAESLLLSSLREKVAIFGEQNEVVSESYNRLARLAQIRNEEGAFFGLVEKSLHSSNYFKDSIQKVIAPLHALETLMLVGDWQEKKYVETGDPGHLLKAFALLDEEEALVKYIQRNFSSDRSKINLANEYREVFESGMDLCWTLYHETKDPIYLEKAFDLSEANRNTTLLQGLQDIQHKMYGDLPDPVLKIEKSIKSQLERVKMDLYYEQSAESPDKEFLAELMNQRIELTTTLDSIYEDLKSKYPKYAQLKYGNTDINLSDIQDNLDQQSQMLVYFLGQEHLYSFSVTRDTIRFLRGKVASKVIEKTNEFKNHLTQREDVLKDAQELYLYLIYQQIVPEKKQIILVPDNILNYIPFEILTDQQERHLIEDYTISYSGGAKIFLELKNEFFDYDSKMSWAGYAPAYEGEKQLPSNEEEVRLIADLIKGDSFLGKEASKDKFLSLNKDYSILHLAMHAEIDNNNPAYNKLIFADTILTASEIYLSECRANLAVLSACNTGFGKLERGEGVMSMARAFHSSGIPSVVMSLWKVPDRETKKIMLHFYGHLKNGDSKSEALQKAKLDYLRETDDPSLRHPYYWAGFVINGNTESLDLPDDNRSLLIGLSVLILLIVGVWSFVKRRKVQS